LLQRFGKKLVNRAVNRFIISDFGKAIFFRQPVPPVFFGNKQKPIKGPQPYSLDISSRLVNVQKAAASSSRKATRALSLFSKSFGSIFSAPKMLLLSMGSLLQKRWSHPTAHGRVPLR